MIKLSLGKKKHVLLKPRLGLPRRLERIVRSAIEARATGSILRNSPGATAEIGLTEMRGALGGPDAS